MIQLIAKVLILLSFYMPFAAANEIKSNNRLNKQPPPNAPHAFKCECIVGGSVQKVAVNEYSYDDGLAWTSYLQLQCKNRSFNLGHAYTNVNATFPGYNRLELTVSGPDTATSETTIFTHLNPEQNYRSQYYGKNGLVELAIECMLIP